MEAQNININDVFLQKVYQQPGERLFAFLDARGDIIEDLTYSDFARRVDALAAELAGKNWLKRGDRVILSFQPGLEIVTALFACAKVGLVAVPTPPITGFDFVAWTTRLDHILKDCQASAWLACSRTLERFENERHRYNDDATREAALSILALPAICTTTLTTNFTGEAKTRGYPIVFLQYTSGSTSKPKGVCVSHANLIANCLAVVDHERPVAVTWLPQHHDMGLIGYYIYIALSGGTTFGLSPRSFVQKPALWLELLSRYRATATSVPNFALEVCLNERRVPTDTLSRYNLSALRFLMVAAEPVSTETFEAFRNRFSRCGLNHDAFFVAFGLAEFTLAVTNYGRKALSVDRRCLAQGRVSPVAAVTSVPHALPIMSCGRPVGDSDVRIVNPDTGAECAAGYTGEIWVAGSGLARGYWNKPEQSEVVFNARLVNAPEDQKPFLRTGDIGFLYNGELYVCGRLKDMIIIRGQNIYPEDIEVRARNAYPDLRGNAVVAFSSGDGHEADVTLVAEAVQGSEMARANEILRVIREGLHVPVVRVVLVPPRSIPRTSSGKVRRADTRALLETGKLTVLADTRRAIDCQRKQSRVTIYELELLKERYGLNGGENFSLIEAGIDSLDLVVFLSWIKDSLIEHGAADLADLVNPQFLTSISIRDLFAVARQFAVAPQKATRLLSEFFAHAFEVRLVEEREKMKADRHYQIKDLRLPALPAQKMGSLVTGGTGFLGPFLIDALLKQTHDDLHVLVRCPDESEGRQRLGRAFSQNILDPSQRAAFDRRVQVVPGDLGKPRLGLTPVDWRRLAEGAETIYHNGALVNYLHTYDTMRAANVIGTAEVLDLCFDGREKILNYISTTFIFGWASTHFLYETDCNDTMDKLDFGYSQSKWAAEQKVLSAMRQGLPARVFRPALITPGLQGGGSNLDITMRLLSFMIKHRLGVTAGNQVSFMPADITAQNIVAISRDDRTLGQTFHVVRDEFETMGMITDIIAEKTDVSFEMLDLPTFVQQVIRRCTRADPLYPLLDFLVGSVDNISSMEFKRYQSAAYQIARDRLPATRPDPSLEMVIDGILRFLNLRNHM
jgi:thioester reductase-like protein